MKKLDKNSMQELKNLNPLLKELVIKASKITHYDFYIINGCGFRTSKQQNDYYGQGKSKLDGFEKISPHQIGNAVDLIPVVESQIYHNNKIAMEEIDYAMEKIWEEMNVKDYTLTAKRSWNNSIPHYEINNNGKKY